MSRILLYLATNLSVVFVAGIILNLLGVSGFMGANGINVSSLLIFCAIFGFIGSFISLMLSKTMAKRAMKVQLITKPESKTEQWLLETVAELADKAGIKMPEVGIFPARESNAFATGWNKNSALVAVSAGLLERFSPDEAKAVLGHEIGHVANGDMVTLALIQGIVNTFVMFFARIIGNFVDKVVFKNEDKFGMGIAYWVTSIIAEMILGILASLIVMWFSRRREFKADQAGAKFAGTQAMIAALEQLQKESTVPVRMPSSIEAFAINGNLASGFKALLMSHPPLEERIAALRESVV